MDVRSFPERDHCVRRSSDPDDITYESSASVDVIYSSSTFNWLHSFFITAIDHTLDIKSLKIIVRKRPRLRTVLTMSVTNTSTADDHS